MATVIAVAGAQSARASALTLTLPAAPAAGDWLVVTVSVGANYVSGIPEVNTPTGWTRDWRDAPASDLKFYVFHLQATSSTPASITFANTDGFNPIDAPMSGVIHQVRGADHLGFGKFWPHSEADSGVVIMLGGASGDGVHQPIGTVNPPVGTDTNSGNAFIDSMASWSAYTAGVSLNPAFTWSGTPVHTINALSFRYAIFTIGTPPGPPPGLVRLPDQAHVAEVRAGATLRPSTRVA